MAIAANVEQFLVKIEGYEDRLRVMHFRGREGINQLYEFELDLVSEDPDVDLSAWMGSRITIQLRDEYERIERYVHGMVFDARFLDTRHRYSRYRIVVSPELRLLDFRQNCRIFQNKSSVDIIKQLLEESGIGPSQYRFTVQSDHAPRDYCVQYLETEYAFIQRLIEEEGMVLYFDHTPDVAIAVIADGEAPYQDMVAPEVLYHEPSAFVPDDMQTVQSFFAANRTQSGAVAMRDYTFPKPTMNLHVAKKAERDQPLEVYFYPGGYDASAQGEQLAQCRLDALRANSAVMEGAGTCRRFKPGFRFKLKDHPQSELDQIYVITEMTQHGDQPQVLEAASSEQPFRYGNRFYAVPATVVYRTYHPEKKPRIHGTQTAIVVGPEAEEIFTNEHGQVKVQFHWDREGAYTENTSLWIRVSQQWAGTGFGSMMIPRIGQEVAVSFVHGDPDRPLVVGRAYNGTHKVPYPLPEHKTKSLLKTNSSIGGDGCNELRIEDKINEEQIFMQSEKDMDLVIEHDTREWIGHDTHLIVVADLLEQTKGDQHQDILKVRQEKIAGTLSTKIDADRMEKTSSKWAHDAAQEIHLNAGQKAVVNAGSQLTIKVGGNFVTCDGSGVSVSGAQVKLNSGGAAGAGSGSSPEAPKLPIRAYNDKPGVPPKEKPQQPEVWSPQSLALIEAAKTGKPFCKICEKNDPPPPQEDAAPAPIVAPQPTKESDRAEIKPVDVKQKTVTIEIKMIDEIGLPLNGAAFTVEYKNGETIRVTSDANGIIKVLNKGDFTLHADDAHEFEIGEGVSTKSGKHLPS